MTTRKAANIQEAKKALETGQQFKTWIVEDLLPHLSGKVKYDRGRDLHAFAQNDPPRVNLSTSAKTLRIGLTLPGRGHNDSDWYMGSLTLTWAELGKYAKEIETEHARRPGAHRGTIENTIK